MDEDYTEIENERQIQINRIVDQRLYLRSLDKQAQRPLLTDADIAEDIANILKDRINEVTQAEALSLVNAIQGMFEREVINHSLVVTNHDLYHRASALTSALSDLYQEIGRVEIDSD